MTHNLQFYHKVHLPYPLEEFHLHLQLTWPTLQNHHVLLRGFHHHPSQYMCHLNHLGALHAYHVEQALWPLLLNHPSILLLYYKQPLLHLGTVHLLYSHLLKQALPLLYMQPLNCPVSIYRSLQGKSAEEDH